MRHPTDRPNIILINCDDLGYGDLGCYGSGCNKTPALDTMAREGMRFTDFYMAAPVCSPSRGAMMTGCYPRRIGFDSFEGDCVLFPGHSVGMSDEEVTVAELLKDQGYATKLVGKWHCGDQPEFLPTRHGFDEYYGLPYSNDMGRQSNRFVRPPLPLLRDEEVIQEQPDQRNLTERYVEECVRFLRDNRDDPFFLYFAHMHVHLPLYAPDRFMKQSDNGRYGAVVECVDWSVDVLMHELNRLGLEENTLVIFTSDNGSRARDKGGSNDPLKGRKGTTWEGGMRVPCVMRWTGQIPENTICEEVASAMDFLPTLADLAGTSEPGDRIIDGHNIQPLMRNEPGAESPHEAFYFYQGEDLEAVRIGRWKLHVAKDGEEVQELYDLRNDIGETNNVAAENPDVVRRVEQAADAARKDLGDGIQNMKGENRRPIGRVENAEPLTSYDPDHPYIIAEYDLPDCG